MLRTEIDSTENVLWHGSFSGMHNVVTTDHSIYVAANYLNEYENGSSPRPTTRPLAVGRYDLTGERIWFQEYLFEESSRNGAINPLVGPNMVSDPSGNLVLSLSHSSGLGSVVV